MKHHTVLVLDVVGGCNLRCPSCPRGNSGSVSNPTGSMPPELLQDILKKAVSECHVTDVWLFNWTEPLLHPDISRLVALVKSYGLGCHLSSNLNLTVDFEELLRAGPDLFIVSASGFHQSPYGITHRGGNVERLKENMARLAAANLALGGKTAVRVNFHRYLGNLDDELLMRAYADSLGFSFVPVWAYLMPVEKLLAYAQAEDKEAFGEELDIVNRFALPMDQALEACRRYQGEPCGLRDDQLVLDCTGEVLPCCGLFDSGEYGLGNYLSMPFEKLQRLKVSTPICRNCMAHGIHVLVTYGAPELDRIAINNLNRYYSASGMVLQGKGLAGAAELRSLLVSFANQAFDGFQAKAQSVSWLRRLHAKAPWVWKTVKRVVRHPS